MIIDNLNLRAIEATKKKTSGIFPDSVIKWTKFNYTTAKASYRGVMEDCLDTPLYFYISEDSNKKGDNEFCFRITDDKYEYLMITVTDVDDEYEEYEALETLMETIKYNIKRNIEYNLTKFLDIAKV